MHDKKLRKLKLLDEQGAEAHKIDPIRSTVKRLSTKIRISIQVVDKISIRVNTLRDEELWPQLNELIQGYVVCCYSFFLPPVHFLTLLLVSQCSHVGCHLYDFTLNSVVLWSHICTLYVL